MIKLLWGPPGTGKTKTVASFLAELMRMKVKTVICAPTNTAVLQVASRLRMMLNTNLKHETYGLGDMILVGNEKKMKVDDQPDISDVFLDHRAGILRKQLKFRWKSTLLSWVSFLENPQRNYSEYLRDSKARCENLHLVSYSGFVDKKLKSLRKEMALCVRVLCKHLPTNVLSPSVMERMVLALEKITKFRGSDLQSSLKAELLEILKSLPQSFEFPSKFHMIKKQCIENACLIFCTASGTAKLVSQGVKKVQLVVIDEAGQLKECESTIPLQLPGLKHAVLIGDERQLPAMVKSKVLV